MDKCKKCGGDLDMYYEPWCPACDKPEAKSVRVLNFIKCLRHIAAITNDKDTGSYSDNSRKSGYETRVWEHLDEQIKGNDSYFKWEPGYDYEFCYVYRGDGKPDDDGVLNADLKLLADTFDIDHNHGVVFEVSW